MAIACQAARDLGVVTIVVSGIAATGDIRIVLTPEWPAFSYVENRPLTGASSCRPWLMRVRRVRRTRSYADLTA